MLASISLASDKLTVALLDELALELELELTTANNSLIIVSSALLLKGQQIYQPVLLKE